MVDIVIGSYTFTDQLRDWSMECRTRNHHHEVPYRKTAPEIDPDCSRLETLEYVLVLRLTDVELRDLEATAKDYSDITLNINSSEVSDTVNIIGLDAVKEMGRDVDGQLNLVTLTAISVAGGVTLV